MRRTVLLIIAALLIAAAVFTVGYTIGQRQETTAWGTTLVAKTVTVSTIRAASADPVDQLVRAILSAKNEMEADVRAGGDVPELISFDVTPVNNNSLLVTCIFRYRKY